MLQRLSSSTASVLDLDKLTDLILEEITSTMHIIRAAFFLKREGCGDFEVVSHRGLDGQTQIKLRAKNPLVLALENKKSLLTSWDIDVMPQFKALWEQETADLEKFGAELFIPLKVVNDLVGILALGPKSSEAIYSRDDELILTILANQTAVAIKNASLFYEVQQLAIIDDLTGIFNRRHLLELGEREFTRAQRFDRSLALIMFDVDDFKLVNDTYGHDIGDEVLRITADRCQRDIRGVDILGRYGGDEFVIILPETNLSDAILTTERLCSQIADIPLETSVGSLNLTASFGIATKNPGVANLRTLLKNADTALYLSKQDERNSFHMFTAELSEII